MDNFVQTVYQKLINELDAIPELKKVDVKNPALVGDRIRRCIDELKNHFKTNPFADKNQEILFFKYEKPAIISEFIYVRELFTIKSNKPIGDREVIDNYYSRELGIIRRFFDQYRYLYQYFQLNGVEFDDLYFCRHSGPLEITLPVAPDIDPEFSTPGDFLYAKFIAYERLQDYLANLLYSPVHPANSEPGHDLQWTGDVINLVELIYGLHLTGQLNHGNISMNELVKWAEAHFNVNIGVIQRKFAEIQARKRISPTKFIDQLKERLLRKMDELNS